MTPAEDLVAALDRVAFARAVGFDPDSWQQDFLRWQGNRLLLNISRQCGKSTTAALYALHEAIYQPKSLTLLISPSLRQSSELFRKVADWVAALETPLDLLEDNALSMKLVNGSRVVSLPSSEATVRGFSGATLIIEDEASRVEDPLYKAVRPMLATSNGRLVLMSTPWGKRGHFHAEWTEGGAQWERVTVKAETCPRISKAFLALELKSLGPSQYAQEYCCSFEDAEDSVFTYDFVQALHDPSIAPLFPVGVAA